MALDAAGVRAELEGHERRQRTCQLPLFFGIKSKDTVSAKVLLDRLDTAAEIAGWGNERKLRELYMILRDSALIWWDSLLDVDIDRANWEAVKAEFLATYEPKYTAKTTCTNFQDLVQRSGEASHDYYLRVHETFSKMCNAKPAALNNVRAAAGAGREDVKKEGMRDVEKFFKHQLFLAGLRDDIRGKVMEAGNESLRDSMRLAIELEVIQQDRKSRVSAVSQNTNVSAIESADHVNEDDELEELGDEELAAVNAIRLRNGRPPYKRRFGQNRKPFNKKSVICHYCKKPGHFQKDCHSRLNAGAPMVPPPKKVQAVTESNGQPSIAAQHAVNEGSSHNVGAITAAAINHLNW